MILLDTNLWVFGILGTNACAERLLDEIERGETVSAINAYMIQEALNEDDRPHNNRDVDDEEGWAEEHGPTNVTLRVETGDVKAAIEHVAADDSLVINGATERGLLSRLFNGNPPTSQRLKLLVADTMLNHSPELCDGCTRPGRCRAHLDRLVSL